MITLFKRRTVITFEKLERCLFHIPEAEPITDDCFQCGRTVDWLTPNQVVGITGWTLRELFRRIEAQSVHFNETAGGLLLICTTSLHEQMRAGK